MASPLHNFHSRASTTPSQWFRSITSYIMILNAVHPPVLASRPPCSLPLSHTAHRSSFRSRPRLQELPRCSNRSPRHVVPCCSSSGSEGNAEADDRAAPASTPGDDSASTSSSGSSSSSFPDSLPLLGENADWRQFRAALVAQERSTDLKDWAHPIPSPEKGSLLLAHPMMFTKSQQYFYQSVILLLENDAATGHWVGVILNRPSQYTLGELTLMKTQSEFQVLEEFESCRLYMGGDVGNGALQLVHTTEGLQGAVEVVKGIYVGGIEAARQKVAAGEATLDQFRWFAQYAGWGPGQLEAECKKGVWFTAACNPDLILQPPSDNNGRDYWHKVLQLMGGNYQALSVTIKNAEAAEGAAKEDKQAGEGDR